jgi:pimeloyl-ACP methyl ester carboxylesterase
MSVVLINGKRLHYESFGRGQPIVFVHGWLGSWRYWVPVMQDLSVEYRTYALDLWGFGDSSKDLDQYTVATYVEMLVAFMVELGIGEAPLVGHTLGAAIAAELAAKHPGRVSRVLAVSLPVTADGINRRLLSVAPNESLARLFWHRQRPHSEVEMGVNKTARNAIALTIQSVAQLELIDTLDEIDVPLLSVYGALDNVVSPDQAAELEANHYAARALVLEGTHHFPMLDQSAKFSRLLRDFMDVDGQDELQDLTIKQEWRRRTR